MITYLKQAMARKVEHGLDGTTSVPKFSILERLKGRQLKIAS
jgi:hypothetical protein